MPTFLGILRTKQQIRGGYLMNIRLKKLRKELSLSQEAFGKRLGITGAGISKMESGDRSITEQMILAICREFNVNEDWLRNGIGNMFLDFAEDEFVKAAALLSDDPFVRGIIIEYFNLDEDGKAFFQNFLCKMVDRMREQE